MAAKTSSEKKASSKSTEATQSIQPSAKKRPRRKEDGTRETVESVAIAFILAFLFKTFQAEAYVIPTGSMAPTLYGRHKEVACDGCGFSFAVGASSEIDQETGALNGRIDNAYCSNCGKRIEAKAAPVFNGDRILVNKQVPGYNRFDVVVFKNPEQGHVNYIKRLVGLPNETIRIRKGDIWAKTPGSDSWEIQRKADPDVQRDIQLTVYDDNFPATALIEAGWPERWEPSVESNADGTVGGWLPTENAWNPNRQTRRYQCNATSDQLQWLRYRHFLANETAWPDPEQVNPDLPTPQAVLITDFCSFNAYDSPHNGWNSARPTGIYWTGDLTISADIDIREVRPNATMALQLVEGPQTFQCNIDLNSGTATLTMATGDSSALPSDVTTTAVMATGPTDITSPGSYQVAFANVDDRICLWVNDSLVTFDGATEYESSDVPEPTQRDLAPCGVAFSNADAEVSSLLLERDIYYRNEAIEFTAEQGLSPNQYPEHEVRREAELQALIHNPEAWAKMYREESAVQLEAYGQYGEYQLDADEYLMFGDNSSMSKDSRLFDFFSRPLNGIYSHRYAVREQDLIGKALFIFWPHGIPFLNGGEGFTIRNHRGPEVYDPQDYPLMRLPFYPDVSRMKKIR
ncbi:MAG: S26 family signal peptidase [Planctomycetaceae bacterium]